MYRAKQCLKHVNYKHVAAKKGVWRKRFYCVFVFVKNKLHNLYNIVHQHFSIILTQSDIITTIMFFRSKCLVNRLFHSKLSLYFSRAEMNITI